MKDLLAGGVAIIVAAFFLRLLYLKVIAPRIKKPSGAGSTQPPKRPPGGKRP